MRSLRVGAGGGYLHFADSSLMKPLWRFNVKDDVDEYNRLRMPQPSGQKRTSKHFGIHGRGGTLVVNADGKVLATDGITAFMWDPHDGSLERKVRFNPPLSAARVEAFTISADGSTCIFGSQGGDFASYEAVAYSCVTGVAISKMYVQGPRFTAMVVHTAFSLSGQYVATLNSSPHGDLDTRVAVYRGPRFLEVRAVKEVEFLGRRLLLTRAQRAELLPAVDSEDHDRLGVLVKLATTGSEPAIVGTILGQIGKAWAA
jgi:hypothetical protein